MSVRIVLTTLSSIAAIVMCPGVAAGATATKTSTAGPTLELVGGDDARAILLDATGSEPPTTFEGDLQLAVRNTSDSAAHVRLLYMPAMRKSSIRLPGSNATTAQLTSVGEQPPNADAVAVKGYDMHVFTVHFRLAASRTPSELNGTINIETVRGSNAERHFEHQLELPVTATLRPVGDVRFDPSSVVVQATRYCLPLPLVNCNTTDGGSVKLTGTGVGALLQKLQRTGTTALTTTLYRDDGKALAATLTDIELDPEHAATADAQLSLDDRPRPGKYTGKLPVSRLVSAAPALPIEVRSHIWFVWVALVIFAGLFLSGGLLREVGLARRKQQLQKIIRRAVGEYQAEAPKNKSGDLYGEPLLWEPPHLSEPLEERPNWTFDTALDSPSNIYTAISWARNDADLDEIEEKAVGLALSVKAWCAALTQVVALRELVQQTRADDKQWRSMAIVSETDLLLRRARHKPTDAAAQAKLLAQVAQQTRWYRHCAAAWELRERLMAADVDTRHLADAVPLKALLEDVDTPATTRTSNEQDALDVRLENLFARLNAICESAGMPEGAEVAITLAPSEQELLAVSYRSQLGLVLAAGAAPTETLTTALAAPGLPAAAAALPVPEVRPIPEADTPQREGIVRNPTQLRRRYHFTDILLSSAILLVTSVVYAATVYDDTWGSLTDWATAFGAGILGKVAVQWTLLPMYRSLRLRVAKADGGTADGAETSAQAAALVTAVG